MKTKVEDRGRGQAGRLRIEAEGKEAGRGQGGRQRTRRQAEDRGRGQGVHGSYAMGVVRTLNGRGRVVAA